MVMAGHIPDHYGRMLFFGGSHPNLGGESFAVFLVAILFCLRGVPFLIAWSLMTYGIYLMQARAALLVAFGVFLIFAWRYLESKRRLKPLYIFSLLAIFSILLLYSWENISVFFTKLFMLADVSRGVGTGFVGRAERWSDALNTFANNPFFGVGFDAFDRDGMLSPHNYFLTGMAYLGMSSFLLFIYLGACIYCLIRRNSSLALCFSPVLFLLIFNDRFINLNVYPFVLYVVIIAAAAKEKDRRLPRAIAVVDAPVSKVPAI